MRSITRNMATVPMTQGGTLFAHAGSLANPRAKTTRVF
jgi:hypothetical protein